MTHYLLDTNIIIYLLRRDTEIVDFFTKLKDETCAISIVSRLEVLIGLKKEQKNLEELESYLDDFENIPLDKEVVREAALMTHYRKGSKLKFKDLIIAATAKIHHKTLITADQDFTGIKKGLRVVVL